MAAGARNWAVLVRPDSVESTFENLSLIEGGNSPSRGAIIVGRLNDAKMVSESRHAKSA